MESSFSWPFIFTSGGELHGLISRVAALNFVGSMTELAEMVRQRTPFDHNNNCLLKIRKKGYKIFHSSIRATWLIHHCVVSLPSICPNHTCALMINSPNHDNIWFGSGLTEPLFCYYYCIRSQISMARGTCPEWIIVINWHASTSQSVSVRFRYQYMNPRKSIMISVRPIRLWFIGPVLSIFYPLPRSLNHAHLSTSRDCPNWKRASIYSTFPRPFFTSCKNLIFGFIFYHRSGIKSVNFQLPGKPPVKCRYSR